MLNAILITDSPEVEELFAKFIAVNFKKIKLSITQTGEEAVDKILCEDHQFIMGIIDVNLSCRSIKDLFNELTDVLEDYPVVFYGDKTSVKAKVPGNIFDINPVNSIINSPINIPDAIIAIKKIMAWISDVEEREQVVVLDKKTCITVKIRNFYRFKKMAHDVFLELHEGSFIKIIRANEEYPVSLIQRYARKGVKYLYIEKSEHFKLLDESIIASLQSFEAKTLPLLDMYQAQVVACSVIHEYVRTIGVCDNVITLSEQIVFTTIECFKKQGNIVKVLQEFPFRVRDLAEQSVLTTYVCEAILAKLGWSAEISKIKLGVASIIHDCTLSNDDLIKITSLDDHNLAMFTEEEQEEFKNHPTVAASIAQNFGRVPEVDFVIAQHHELPSGKGFPQGTNSHQITELSCIFIVANSFVGELSQRKISRKSVLKICESFEQRYNIGNFRKPMQALRRLFN